MNPTIHFSSVSAGERPNNKKDIFHSVSGYKWVLVLLALIYLIPQISSGQGANQYSFQSIRGTFTPISGTPIVFPPPPNADDDFANGFPLPFRFTFAGVQYQLFNVSTNGWITFGDNATPNNITGSGLTNNFNTLPSSPLLAPFWDDIALTSSTDLGSNISYAVLGSSPNRQVVIQYDSIKWNYSASTASLRFQIILYETTNVIDFVYDQISTTINNASGGASIGIASGNGNYLSLSSSASSASASSTVNTTNISALPDVGQVFRFTPPPPCSGTPAPGATAATVTSICAGTSSSTILSFPPVPFSGLSYQWQSSTDNINWSSNGPTTATWTATPTVTTFYRCQVICSNGGASGFSAPIQVVIDNSCVLMPAGASSASQCGGTFYDTGGPLANYQNNENNTFTIFPTIPGGAVRVNFTSFNTESGWDGLLIFDGNSTAAPLISSGLPAGVNPPTAPAGSFYGTTSPGIITSSAADGSLTFVFTSDNIITRPGWTAAITCIPPCSGTPNPDSTLSSLSFVCAGYSTNLSLKNTFAGLTYDWQSSPDNITYTSTGVTTSTYSPVLTANTWFRCVVNCTSSGRSGTSIPVLVNSSVCDEIIMPADTTVLVETTCSGLFVDNGGSRNNYSNNARGTVTIYPTTPGRKVRASFVSFSTENNWDGLMIYNGNSTAAPLISSGLPAGFNATTAPAGSFYGTLSPGTITSTAADGSLTFVFRSDGSINLAGWQAIISCFDPNACAGTPNPGNTVAGSSTICYGASTNLSLQNTTAGTGVTYLWQSSADNINWTNAPGNGTLAAYLAQPLVSTYFRCRVSCGVNTGNSTSIRILVDATCINMPDTGSIATCSATFYDAGGSAGNYFNSDLQTFTIRPTAPNNVIKVLFNTFSLEQNDTLRVYNGIGTASLIGAYTTSPGTLTSISLDGALTFVFKSNSTINDIGWSATVSCVSVAPCTSPPAPGSTVFTADTVCAGSTVGLSLSNSLGLGTTYQWQESTLSSTSGFTDIAPSTTNPPTNPSYLATVASTRWYRCNVTCQGSTVASAAVKITTVAKPAITASSQTGSICGVGTGTLTATASAGIIRWYSVASGGTAIGNGSPFTTPSINVTTTYYVGSSLGDCQSDRIAVTALVSPVPAVLTVTPATASICASPRITTIAVTGGLFPDGSEAPVTWSPQTYLYIDAAATIPLTSSANVRIVYCMPPVSANGTSITYTVTAGTNCTRTATSVITVSDIRPDISIFINRPTQPGTICQSDTIEFRTTPLPSSLGAQAGYKWFFRRAGVTNQVPAPGAAFNTGYNIVKFPGLIGGAPFPQLQNGDSVFCIMVVSPTAVICTDSRVDTSNRVGLSISPTIRDSVLLSASRNNPLCAGEPVTFTATPYTSSPYGSPGSFPTYEFFKNGISQGAASGTTTFTSSTLATGDVITVRMVPSNRCALPNPAVSVPITLTVDTKVKPTFDPSAFAPICIGGTITLPSSSTNTPPITGTWTPGVNNNQSTTYTFNPNQCADTVMRTVIVNTSPSTPTFNAVAPICSPNTGTLPATSIEGFTGSWAPSSSYAASGTYTFTPTAGLCANTATLSVTVNPLPTASISSNNGPVCDGASGQYFITGTPNATVTYNISGSPNATVTLSNTGAATITATNVTGDSTLNLVSVTANSCNNTLSASSTITRVSTAGGGPLSGRYYIPVNSTNCLSGLRGFPTIREAIDSLNKNGVAGNVFFDIRPGYTETITAKLVIGSASSPLYSGTNATSVTQAVTFRKNPDSSGVNPKIIAYTGGTGTPALAVPDGMVAIRGVDYITFDAVDLEENASNSGNALMEYGYGLFKESVTNGAQNNTIQNCNITLNRNNVTSGAGTPLFSGSVGIAVYGSADNTATTAISSTSAAGANSRNRFYSNKITNCNIGIGLNVSGTISATNIGDSLNDVGGSTATTGNFIFGFGGGASATVAAVGVRTNNQYSINISNNLIRNDSTGVNHVNSVYGIQTSGGTSSSLTISNNYISVTCNAAGSSVFGIENAAGSTAASNSVVIRGNTVTGGHPAATTGTWTGIYTNATAATVQIRGNTVRNVSIPTTSTGAVNLIQNAAATPASAFLNIDSNNVINNSIGGGTGARNMIVVSTSGSLPVAGSNITVNVNNVSNNTMTSPATPLAITLNCITQVGSSTYTVNGNTINQNSITNMTGAVGARINGYINSGGIQTETVSNNTISNLFITTGSSASTVRHTIYGISNNTNASSIRSVTGNSVFNLYSSSGISDSIIGINSQVGGNTTISRNRVYNLFPGYNATAGAPLVSARGIWLQSFTNSGGTINVNVNNNMVALDLTQAASATGSVAANSVLVSSAGSDAIRGIDISSSAASTNYNLYNNSIRLAGTGSTTFSSSGLSHVPNASATIANLDLRGNIIVNECTPQGAGLTIAFRKIGLIGSNENANSNYNNYYAGTAAANRLLYYDGTNSVQTIGALLTPRNGRDANAISVLPGFTGATDLHLLACNPNNLLIEDAYPLTPLVAVDYDNQTRNNPSDLGADEILPSGTGTVNASTSVCSGSNTGLLSLSGQLFGSSIVRWEGSTDSISWTPITNVTDSLRYTNLTATTWYRAVVSNPNCASGTSKIAKITVNPAPTAGTLNAPVPLATCTGAGTQVIRLTGYTGSNLSLTFRKSGINVNYGGVFSGQGTDSLKLTNPTAAEAGSYDVVVGSAGCASVISNAVTVTVNELPAASTDALDTAICGSGTATVRATAPSGTTIDWYAAATGGSPLAGGTGTSSFTTPSNSTTTTYYAETRNTTTGCKSSTRDAAIVTVYAVSAASTPSYSGTYSRCLNGPVFGTLNANLVTGATYQWYFNNTGNNTSGTLINGATGSGYSPPVNVSYTNNYYYYIRTDSTGCRSTSAAHASSFSVTTRPPAPQIRDTAICGARTITLNSTQNVTWYSVSSGGAALATNTTTFSPNVGSTTTYWAAAVGTNGCESSGRDSVKVTVSSAGTWLGANSNWSSTVNWCDGQVPTSTTPVTIPVVASGIYPIISGTAAASNITIASGASMTITTTGVLSTTGSWANSGTLTDNGIIRLTGTGTQNFPGGTGGSVSFINVLEIANGTGSTSITAPLTITGTLLPTSGTLNLGNNDVTIRSSADSTASVGAVGATINYGTGRFIIERYVSSVPKWHLLAAPINDVQSIKNAWQEGNAPRGNTNPGYGTWITTNNAAQLANGFDTLSPGGASMKYYNQANSLYDPVTNTNDPISNADGRGYFVYVRGDRSCSPTNGRNVPTILRTRGQVYTGGLTRNVTDSFACFGNPYPSAINFGMVTRAGGVSNAFYVWDPQLGGTYGLGQFRICTSDGAGDYTVTPFSPNVPATGSYPTDKNKFIQSGQAFFVSSPGRVAGSISFSETCKDDGSRNVFRPMPPLSVLNMLRVNLLAEEQPGTLSLLDGCLVEFSNSGNNKLDNEDFRVIPGSGIKFCISSGGSRLMVERRRAPIIVDSIRLFMSGLQRRTYKMELDARRWTLNRLEAFVRDNYLGTLTPVRLGEVNILDFMVDTKPQSSASNRFVIVFRIPKGKAPISAPPPVISSVRATESELPLAAGEEGMMIYPNPVDRGGVMNIEWPEAFRGRCRVLLTSPDGKVVYSRSVSGNHHYMSLLLPRDISSGIYIVNIIMVNGRRFTGKVTVE